MLHVARAAAPQSGAAIEWRQGNAGALPFPDAGFDAVLSQQMLQFASERTAALAEMRRVLAPSGRVAILVCRPIQHWPAYLTLAEALQRHAGAAAGDMVRSIFPPWGLEELRASLAAGGFRDVRVLIEVEGKRYPSPSEFLRQEAASSPLAGPIAALAPMAREALVRELGAALRERVDDAGVAFPIECYLATARR
jgi:SAM-dependent methyltransferase